MVKRVLTSIITLAVLMGVLVACSGTTQVVAPTPEPEPEPIVEETPEEVAEPLSTADQFELVKGGVVRLEVATCEAGGTGTGFLIDEYHVVTVAHVVDEAQEIIAYVDDEIAIAEVVAIDIDRELALLRTDIPVGSYYFSLGDFEYRTGDEVSVIGFPRALDLTLTVGTISNDEVSFDDLPLVKFMQIDAAANPGNSGGPVLNNYGEVVGILQGGFADSEGLNFAISVDSVDRILSSWVDNTPISFPACGSGSSTTEPVASSESVLHPPAEVRVLVANATDVSGAAGAVRDFIVSEQGYNGLPPVVATTEEVSDSSFVYYANGYELDAKNVGLIIGVDSANVLPMPVVLPVADLSEANVLVLLGSDLFTPANNQPPPPRPTPTPQPTPTPTPSPPRVEPATNVIAQLSGSTISVSWNKPVFVDPTYEQTLVVLFAPFASETGVGMCNTGPYGANTPFPAGIREASQFATYLYNANTQSATITITNREDSQIVGITDGFRVLVQYGFDLEPGCIRSNALSPPFSIPE